MRKTTRQKSLDVLIVEDEAHEAQRLREILSERGWSVEVASDGIRGLVLAKRLRPRVIVSDIIMPLMDGYRLCRAVKEDKTLKKTPVLLLTCLSGPVEIIEAIECGADHYVAKPYRPEVLVSRIEAALREPPGRKTNLPKQAIDLNFLGRQRSLEFKSAQIVELLFSGFENTLEKNRTLLFAEQELKRLNVDLEQRVEERTKELKASEERLTFLAHFDGLTSLPRRPFYIDRLRQALARAPWQKRLVGVAYLDLDRFKPINETFGHEMGDRLLVAVAERLQRTVRSGDSVARLGDDEFGLLLDGIAKIEDLPPLVEKLMSCFSEPFHLDGQELFVTASVGLSIFPNDGQDAETLLQCAGAAMALVKDQGKNKYQFYLPQMNAAAMERVLLTNNLRKAMERGEFSLHYQPQVSLSSGRVIGVEALLRWKHPDLGYVSPAKFIPLAEENGMILPIGEWVLRTACRQAVAWQSAGMGPLRMAVNLSGRQFHGGQVGSLVQSVLQETGINPELLELELTETTLLEQREEVTGTLNKFRELGVRFSIDDFGTGYSSMSYLKRFPIHVLKIDQSFIRDLTSSPDDRAIVQAIITLAHSLRQGVVAEGVETMEQLSQLRNMDCDIIQGYLFSKPLPAEELESFLRSDISLQLPARTD